MHCYFQENDARVNKHPSSLPTEECSSGPIRRTFTTKLALVAVLALSTLLASVISVLNIYLFLPSCKPLSTILLKLYADSKYIIMKLKVISTIENLFKRKRFRRFFTLNKLFTEESMDKSRSSQNCFDEEC